MLVAAAAGGCPSYRALSPSETLDADTLLSFRGLPLHVVSDQVATVLVDWQEHRLRGRGPLVHALFLAPSALSLSMVIVSESALRCSAATIGASIINC